MWKLLYGDLHVYGKFLNVSKQYKYAYLQLLTLPFHLNDDCIMHTIYFAEQQVNCEPGWHFCDVTSSCVLIVNGWLSQLEAKSRCVTYGAYLLEIKSVEAQAWIMRLLQTQGWDPISKSLGYLSLFLVHAFVRIFLCKKLVVHFADVRGAYYIGLEGFNTDWAWGGSSEKLKYESWCPHHPSGIGTCVEINPGSACGWRDTSCGTPRGAICEKPASNTD